MKDNTINILANDLYQMIEALRNQSGRYQPHEEAFLDQLDYDQELNFDDQWR